MNSASICSLAGRYDNPIPTQFLAPIDCLKIPALADQLLLIPATDNNLVTQPFKARRKNSSLPDAVGDELWNIVSGVMMMSPCYSTSTGLVAVVAWGGGGGFDARC
jgi:hypothetical protein